MFLKMIKLEFVSGLWYLTILMKVVINLTKKNFGRNRIYRRDPPAVAAVTKLSQIQNGGFWKRLPSTREHPTWPLNIVYYHTREQ